MTHPTRLNDHCGDERYDYMDFYMGTLWLGGRADLRSVYELIFKRLRARDADWVYHFPRLALVDMRPLIDSLKPADQPEWENYSPSESFAKQQADEQHDAEMAELRDRLDESHREAVEKAQDAPLSETVEAYQRVFGRLPKGWPPSAEQDGHCQCGASAGA